MKKIVLLASILLAGNTAFCQQATFNAFQLNLGLGLAYTQASPYISEQNGYIFSIEPQYSPIDPLTIGLRFDLAVFVSKSSDFNTNGEIGQGEVSDLVTGKYYFTDTRCRPFAGLGAGIARIVAVGDNGAIISQSINFNGMARIGLDYSHFWMDLEYNLVPGHAPLSQNSYIAIKIGGYIGGGRIN